MDVDQPFDVINQAFQEPKQKSIIENQALTQNFKVNQIRRVPQQKQFLEAIYFIGPKQGYYFSTGSLGTGGNTFRKSITGYYLDTTQNQEQAFEFEDEQQNQTGEQLLAEAEDQAKQIGAFDEKNEHMDAKSLKRLINQFQKKYQDNLNLRLKFPEEPPKFMESEVDLDSEIRNLTQVSSYPHLYDIFVETNALQDLVNILTNHENVDIVAEVIEVLKDMTEADVIESQSDQAKVLVEALLGYGGLEVLVQRLGSYTSNSDDDNQNLFNILSIFENLIEIDANIAIQVTQKTKLLKWLIQRLKVKEVDSTQQYVSELLAILLHSQTTNQQMFSTLGGVEALLRTLAQYRRRNPSNEDEEEYVHNLFDALCSSMLQNENKIQFIRMEGVDLMKLMMHSKVKVRLGVIKVLDFLTTRFVNACERLIDQGCLKYIFAIIMGKSKLPGRKKGDQDEQEELQHTVSIVSNLFQNVYKPSKRDRIASKFVENEFEKTDRIMELFFDYHQRQLQQEDNIQELIEQEEMSEQEAELTRMEAGLFTLQQISIIIGQLWGTGDVMLRKRVLLLLHSKRLTLSMVADYIAQMYFTLGEDLGKDEYIKISQRLEKILQTMGVSTETLREQQQVPEQFQQELMNANEQQYNNLEIGNVQLAIEDMKKGQIDNNRNEVAEDLPQTPPPIEDNLVDPSTIINGVNLDHNTKQQNGDYQNDSKNPLDNVGQHHKQKDEDQTRKDIRNKDTDNVKRDKENGREKDRDKERERDGRRQEDGKDRRDKNKDKDRERDREREREREREKEGHKKYADRDREKLKGDSHKRRHEDRGDARDRHKSSRHK